MMETESVDLEVRAGDTNSTQLRNDVTIKQELENEAQTDNLVDSCDGNELGATIKFEDISQIDGENIVKCELVEFYDNYVTAEISNPNDVEIPGHGDESTSFSDERNDSYNNFDCNENDDSDSTSDPEDDPFADIDCDTSTSFSQTAGEDDSKPYKCQECLLSFPKLYLLMKHVKSHRNEQVFKCPMPNCDSAFNLNKVLVSHLLQVHTKKRPFQCPEPNCRRTFTTKHYLDRHTASHVVDGPVKCSHPDCTRKSQEVISTRQLTVYAGSGNSPYKHTATRLFKCKECQDTFCKNWQLTLHLKSHAIEILKCPQLNCDFQFYGKRNLELHVAKYHTNPDAFIFECPEPNCWKKFTKKNYLQRHKAFHVLDGPFKCSHPDCTRPFKSEEVSTRQLTVYEGPGHPPYQHRAVRLFKCKECDGTFCKNWQLTLHLKSHANEMFKCQERNCDLTFTSKRNLELHIAKFHTNPDEFPFLCPEPKCEAKFKFKNSVKVHVTHIHRKTDSTSFKCKEPNCNKKFRSKRCVNLHAKSHKRPYKCAEPDCAADFARKEQLTAHLKSRHKNNNPNPMM